MLLRATPINLHHHHHRISPLSQTPKQIKHRKRPLHRSQRIRDGELKIIPLAAPSVSQTCQANACPAPGATNFTSRMPGVDARFVAKPSAHKQHTHTRTVCNAFVEAVVRCPITTTATTIIIIGSISSSSSCLSTVSCVRCFVCFRCCSDSCVQFDFIVVRNVCSLKIPRFLCPAKACISITSLTAARPKQPTSSLLSSRPTF